MDYSIWKVFLSYQMTYGLLNLKGIFELSNNLWITQSEKYFWVTKWFMDYPIRKLILSYEMTYKLSTPKNIFELSNDLWIIHHK